jgi:hypothetical protein
MLYGLFCKPRIRMHNVFLDEVVAIETYIEDPRNRVASRYRSIIRIIVYSVIGMGRGFVYYTDTWYSHETKCGHGNTLIWYLSVDVA